MRGEKKKTIGMILIAAAMLIVLLCVTRAIADEALYVACDYLNGRREPNKRSEKVVTLEFGWEIVPTGNTDGNWIEIYGSEYGTCWVFADYVTERDAYQAKNISGGRVRVRQNFDGSGRLKAYIKAGKTVVITRVIRGRGYIHDLGWVDLNCFEGD